MKRRKSLYDIVWIYNRRRFTIAFKEISHEVHACLKLNRCKGENTSVPSVGADNIATAIATRRIKMITLAMTQDKIFKNFSGSVSN